MRETHVPRKKEDIENTVTYKHKYNNKQAHESLLWGIYYQSSIEGGAYRKPFTTIPDQLFHNQKALKLACRRFRTI